MKTPRQDPPSREERLARALKANIARRKAQARARAEDEDNAEDAAAEPDPAMNKAERN